MKANYTNTNVNGQGYLPSIKDILNYSKIEAESSAFHDIYREAVRVIPRFHDLAEAIGSKETVNNLITLNSSKVLPVQLYGAVQAWLLAGRRLFESYVRHSQELQHIEWVQPTKWPGWTSRNLKNVAALDATLSVEANLIEFSALTKCSHQYDYFMALSTATLRTRVYVEHAALDLLRAYGYFITVRPDDHQLALVMAFTLIASINADKSTQEAFTDDYLN